MSEPTKPDFEVAARSLNDALWQLAAKGSSGKSADKAMDKADIIAVEALQAAYQQGQQSRWRTDIENAKNMPRATRLVLRVEGVAYAPCWWSPAGELSEDGCWCWMQSDTGGWINFLVDPTHWMEITPPKEGE